MNKDLIKLIVKIILYIITAVAAYFGVSAFTSCTAQRNIVTRGHGMVVTYDTIYINHDGNYQLDIR